MEFVEQLAKVMPTKSNIMGLVFVQGRMAFEQGKSIFDQPFEVGSDKAEMWMDGFMFAERKARV